MNRRIQKTALSAMTASLVFGFLSTGLRAQTTLEQLQDLTGGATLSSMRSMPGMPGKPSNPQAPGVSLQAAVYVDGQQQGLLTAGAPATLAFEFTDASGQVLRDFDPDDTKLMHLIIVRDDHSTYAHVHPVLDVATGRFTISINQPNSDPDNQDAAAAIPIVGNYDLYAQIVPKGGAAQTIHLQIQTINAAQEQRVAQQLDGTLPDQQIAKDIPIPADPSQGFYRTTLGAMIMQGMAPTLSLHLEQCQITDGACQPVSDLEPWLGMEGHAILISQDGSIFRHWHAMGGGGMGPMSMGGAGSGNGPDLSFMAMEGADPTLPPGQYSVWLTVKRQERIVKLPYFVRVSGGN